ncbi:MAG: hypothetical protein K2Q22_14490, partial [Cytophagales bacterium]|nr:hypothetical protein [Cytophagales bacterium]
MKARVKQILLFLIILILSSVVSILTVEAQTSNKSATNPNLLLEQHHKIQKIIVSQKNVIRGYDFGVAYSEVRSTEKALLIGEGDNFAIYQVDFGHKETADILYYLDVNKKVTGFGVSILVPSNAEEHHLYKDFTNYFNERFGKFTVNDKGSREWHSGNDYTIEMGESRDGDSHAIELEYTKI